MKKVESWLWVAKECVPNERLSVDLAVNDILGLWGGLHAGGQHSGRPGPRGS